MKKVHLIVPALAAALMSGCAVAPFQPGSIYSQQKMPVDAPNNATSCAKKGTGTATNVLGLFAFGDGSIASAKKSAGITKVDSVDVSHIGLLGIFGTTTTEVCGE